MRERTFRPLTFLGAALVVGFAFVATPANAQMIDQTQAPNGAHDGIAKSLAQEVGAGRG